MCLLSIIQRQSREKAEESESELWQCEYDVLVEEKVYEFGYSSVVPKPMDKNELPQVLEVS